MEGGFWSDLFRNILGWVDSLIFGFISSVYNTFTNVASYTIINNDIIKEFNQRIYVLLGVFMLFKLAFSLVSYFIDPDKMTDKKSGAGNLVQRVVLSLVLLVLTPTFFNIAFKAQTYIIKENILANIILGGQYDEFSLEERQQMYSDAGGNMAFTTLSAFMHPVDNGALELSDEELEKEYVDDPDTVKYIKEYKQARVDNNIDALVGWYKLNTKEDVDGYYIFDYTPIISTIAGIMVLWILVIFCIDIGVRSVKLAFLQLIAPIPIIGYIDTSKGESAFKKWYTSCFTTYLELFMKLLAIYFVIFLITLITKTGFSEYVIDENGNLITQSIENPDYFAKAFIIIGLLIFANEVPKLIGDMFGVKSDGFSLNPMKRIGTSPLAAAAVGGVAGATMGLGASLWNAGRQIKQDGLKKTLAGQSLDKNGQTRQNTGFKAFRYGTGKVASTLVGSGFGSASRAVVSGLKGEGKVLSMAVASKKATLDKREQKEMYKKNNIGFIQRATDRIDRAANFKNKEAGYGLADEKVNKLKEQLENIRRDEIGFREARTTWASNNAISVSELNRASAVDENGNFIIVDYNDYMAAYNADTSPKGRMLSQTEFDDDRNRFADNIRVLNNQEQSIEKDIRNNEKIVKAQEKSKKG